ncbi:WecB/TagA/CpsF family glycosyltransferase [Geobacter sp. DSM 9736]|uniref:WecB/TagA/CpsF family glycosyltransferase n=1 Tax=Geobacter sp. DSM 9736 TaxID=1277350 RepID=UPI000B511DD2|nr:WecB/TagA/CpsF family glycosyltransferase [Geobacter sp. DSM 9736]SNB46136.1 N-acetylglucosaminyldiphosphoundecaprenol N-acetyl-beta-D-mannosaminyltransferase [Geobacter sp. DSM 9736]
MSIEYVEFKNVKISSVNYGSALQTISRSLRKGRKGYVCVTDVGNVIAATKDRSLKEAINGSLLSIADGTPLAWFARLVGCRNIERVSGMDLMVGLFREKQPFRHFLLGDTEQTISRVIEKALQLNPALQITGYSPPFREFTQEDNRDIIDRINASRADIIWVSFGGGRQEQWMMEHHTKIRKGIMVGIGAGFRWFIGDIKVPPRIVQKVGLQWLYRMGSEIRNDPARAIVRICQRPLRRFPVFIAHFPFQLFLERRRIQQSNPNG